MQPPRAAVQVTAFEYGGAGRAALRLQDALGRAGWRSHTVVSRRTGAGTGVTTLAGEAGVPGPVAQAEQLAPRLSRFTGDMRLPLRSPGRFAESERFARADVVNLHQLHGNWFDFKVLPRWAERKPLVWTLHDMWPFTGHCAYSYDCDRWRTGCYDSPLYSRERRPYDDIPQLPVDTSRLQWRAKRTAYEHTPLTVVTPSAWLAAMARESILVSHPGSAVHHVPNGLDTDVYAPRERAASRAGLDLPADAPVLLFGADSLARRRKGIAHLRDALGHLRDAHPDLWLLTLGAAGTDLGWPAERIRSVQVDDEERQADVYSAADVAVVPSVADNQPLMAVEALACGVPVVGFDVGGVPEVVRDGETGLVAPAGDGAALGRAIASLLDDPALRARLGDGARRLVLAEHSLDVQGRRYAALYEDALAATRPSGRRR
jgi:glycosyltransferase involved in cell wall biosynthesis